MIRCSILSLALVLATAAPVWADGTTKAPKADYGWVGIIIAVVLVVGVIIASMTSSKRGHQD